MASASDPNSPFLDSQVSAALGGRPAGTPSSAGMPGVQAANVSYPAPPAAGSAPGGRPAAQSIPAPPMPVAPTPSAAGPAAPLISDMGSGGPAAPAPAASGIPASSPEDTQRYREAVLHARTRLGPIPNVFRHPNLPEIPIALGSANYNPFTGLWS